MNKEVKDMRLNWQDGGRSVTVSPRERTGDLKAIQVETDDLSEGTPIYIVHGSTNQVLRMGALREGWIRIEPPIPMPASYYLRCVEGGCKVPGPEIP
jgi:hypothetical protein